MSEVLDLADEQKELQQFKEVEEVQQTLEERLEKLANIDTTIYDLLDSVSNITQSLDKEKQLSKTKMDEAYKNVENKLNAINEGISSQLHYLEQMCLGAEHNGSSAPSILSLDLAKQRMAHLYRELEDIHEKL